MAGSKLYQSKAWLKKRYLIDRKSPEEIAEECGATRMTIYNYLNKYDLIRKG